METQANGQQANKIPKIRSVAYPYVSIKACVELTQKIDDEFTDVVFTPRENISKNLGVSGGGLERNLSSSVQYGLLEMKSKLGYKPTPLFKKIRRPLPNENVIDLLRECLQSPELYKKLIRDFNDKQLPTVSGLANILDRLYSVKGDAAERAARVFLNNLEALEVIGEDNILKIEGGLTQVEEVEHEDENENEKPHQQSNSPLLLVSPASQNNATNQPQYQGLSKEIPVFLSGGREGKIILPLDFTDADIKKVAKVLTGYLPDE